MKKIFLFLSFLSCFCLQNLSAKTMHLFLLGDTADPNIGHSSIKDLRNIKESFSYLAKVGDFDFSPEEELTTTEPEKSSKHLTRKNILHWIRKKSIASDDIVILYYTGHGKRELENRTFLPSGHIENDKRYDKQKIVDFADIAEHLLSKKASLYLIVTDCCNALASKGFSSNILTFELEKSKTLIDANAASQLFQKRGFIVVSATSPNEFGWGQTPDSPGGSVFTTLLLNNLFTELQSLNPSWENVLKNAQMTSSEETKKEKYRVSQSLLDKYKPPHTFQTPRYEMVFFDRKRSTETYKKTFLRACRYKYKSPIQTVVSKCAEDDEDAEFSYYLKKICSGILPDYLIVSRPQE